MWDALLPDGAPGIPSSPYLESIPVFNNLTTISLLDYRENNRFGLRHLELWGMDGELAGEFRPLVEELQVFSKSEDPSEKVHFILMDGLDVC